MRWPTTKAVLVLSVVLVAQVCLAGEEAASLGPPKDLCDLDVTFIQQMPFYGGYGFEYPGNVPTMIDGKLWREKRERRWIFTKAESDAVDKHAPDPGEEMTLTAHVINNGGKASPPAPYLFKMDERMLKKGSIPAPVERGASKGSNRIVRSPGWAVSSTP